MSRPKALGLLLAATVIASLVVLSALKLSLKDVLGVQRLGSPGRPDIGLLDVEVRG